MKEGCTATIKKFQIGGVQGLPLQNQNAGVADLLSRDRATIYMYAGEGQHDLSPSPSAAAQLHSGGSKGMSRPMPFGVNFGPLLSEKPFDGWYSSFTTPIFAKKYNG